MTFEQECWDALQKTKTVERAEKLKKGITATAKLTEEEKKPLLNYAEQLIWFIELP